MQRTLNELDFLIMGTGSGLGQYVFSNQLLSGAFTSALVEIQGTIGFGGSTAATIAQLATDGSGYPQVTDGAGLALQVSGSKLANVAGTQITGTTLTSIGFMTVPGGDVETGASYQIHASGSFSHGTSVPSSETFTVFWGGIGGTAIATLAVPTITASLSGSAWFLDAEVNWISTTECEVTLRLGWHTAGGVAGSVTWFTVAETTGLSTTGNENLSLGFKFGSAPAGTNFLCDVSRIGRVA